MALDDLDDRLTVTFEGCGWAHCQIMLRMRLKSKQGGGQYMISYSKAKKPANLHLQAFVFFGSPTRNRNRDLRIKSVDRLKISKSNPWLSYILCGRAMKRVIEGRQFAHGK